MSYTKLIADLNNADELTADHRILSLTDRAASAIEALQAKVDRLTKENRELAADRPEMEEVNGHWEWRKPNGEVLLPERGKWVGVSPTVDTVQCSICGGQLFSEELETPYCPYCGAKMTEVQDGQ